MSADELRALAARVCAEPPSRDLDGLIYMATRPAPQRLPVSWKVLPDTGQIYAWSHPPPHAPGTGGVWARAPEYTTSLDAAASAMPEGWHWGVLDNGQAYVTRPEHGRSTVQAATPAAALTAAALLARAADMEARHDR